MTSRSDVRVVAHRIRPARALTVALVVNAVFLAAYVATEAARFAGVVTGTLRTELARLFDLDSEVSIPKWWELSLMLVLGLLLFQIAVVLRRSGDRSWEWWTALGAIFLIASLDETIAIHESLMGPLKRLWNIWSGPLAATWVFPVLLVMLVAVVVFLRFYLRLPALTRVLFAVALAMFLVGAVGFEFLEAWDPIEADPDPLQQAFKAAEETLETSALAVFGYALLRFIGEHLPPDPLAEP